MCLALNKIIHQNYKSKFYLLMRQGRIKKSSCHCCHLQCNVTKSSATFHRHSSPLKYQPWSFSHMLPPPPPISLFLLAGVTNLYSLFYIVSLRYLYLHLTNLTERNIIQKNKNNLKSNRKQIIAEFYNHTVVTRCKNSISLYISFSVQDFTISISRDGNFQIPKCNLCSFDSLWHYKNLTSICDVSSIYYFQIIYTSLQPTSKNSLTQLSAEYGFYCINLVRLLPFAQNMMRWLLRIGMSWND